MICRLLVSLTVVFVIGCESPSPSPDPEPDSSTEPEPDSTTNEETISVTSIAQNLEAPWDIVITDDQRIFLTERDSAQIVELIDDETEPFHEFSVDETGEGGLLGLAVSPDYEEDRSLYVYMTTDQDNRVLRFSVDDPDDSEVIISDIPSAAIHDGGRVAFGPDDHLYISTGDANNPQSAQDPDSLAGKILRLTPDGSIPDDNPFEDSPVFSLGHRNVQGLAWNADGELYATEFGPNVDDEINHIEAGNNYGWPEVTGVAENPDFTDPIFVRQPNEASWSGTTFLVDGAIDDWEGSLFAASLRGNRLWRLELSEDGSEVIEHEELLVDQWGRLRQVIQAPDGALWVLTNNRDGRGSPSEEDDQILRIGP